MRWNDVILLFAAVTALSAAPGWTQSDTGAAGPAWHDSDLGPRITDEGPAAGVGKRIALYPLSRLADLLDMMSAQFGFGLGLHANGHATRVAQFGLGIAGVQRFGFDGRHFCMANEAKSEFSFGPLMFEHFRRHGAFRSGRDYEGGADLPWLYTKRRDYWGVGAEATIAIVTFAAEAHPVQVVDALLGFFFVDIMRDDLGHDQQIEKPTLTESEVQSIRRVVIVPSRVTRSRDTRMARDGGLGCYYHRFPRETRLGKLGGWMGGGRDRRAANELTASAKERNLDVHRELLERAELLLTVHQGWEVVGVDEALRAFKEHSVIKEGKGLSVRRLPNYRGLAEYYGADAVLDVRVHEWGVWRGKRAPLASMRLDCQYQLVAYPKKDLGGDPRGRLLFNTRVVSYQGDKPGRNLVEFAKYEGQALATESKEACDLVHAQIADYLVETR
jgi:hypothetical protein